MGTKISEMTSVSSLSGAEVFPAVQSGTTKKTIISDIGTVLGSGYILVASAIVSGSPATSISFTGLDLDSAGKYLFIGTIKNNVGSNQGINLNFNGDATDSNYVRIVGLGHNGGIVGATLASRSIVALYASASSTFYGHLHKDGAGYTRSLTRACEGNGYSQMAGAIRGLVWNNSANVTSLDFQASASNAIGTGSWLKIYRHL